MWSKSINFRYFVVIMTKMTFGILILLILNSLTIVCSLNTGSNKPSKSFFEINCFETNINGSCLPENVYLPSLWTRKHNRSERFTNRNRKFNSSLCSGDIFNVTFPINNFTQNTESSKCHNVPKTINLEHDGHYYTSDEYCLSKLDSDYAELQVCKQNCHSEHHICIPKCCPLGQSLNILENSFHCLDNDVKEKLHFLPTVYSDEYSRIGQNESDKLKVHFYAFNHSCAQMVVSQSRRIETLTKKGFHARLRLLRNGELMVRMNNWTTFHVSGSRTFCLESLHNEAEVVIALLCNEKGSLSNPRPNYRRFITALNIVEGSFTMATVVVYILLWRRLKNTHRLAQFFHVTCYALLLMMKVIVFSINDSFRGQTICVIIGIVTNYLILATGSWMVIINFDLFLIFWKMEGKSSETSKKHLLSFCFYGWITPLIPITIGLILESQYKDDNETNIVIPEYGKYSKCFVSYWAAYYYVFIPIVLDYLIVLVLFSTTAKIIYNHKKSVKLASDHSTRHYIQNNSRRGRISADSILTPTLIENFKLFSKLAVLSGLLGLLDILSVLPYRYRLKLKIVYDIYQIFDHILGFALFFLYVYNGDTIKELKHQYQNVFALLPMNEKSDATTEFRV